MLFLIIQEWRDLGQDVHTAKAAVKEGASPRHAFAIMPISDQDGYPKGHFNHVYEDIIRPACESAGFRARRADDVKQTNLIHLDVLQNLIDAPMAVCDLSTRNPNVLFELGIRQAFDRPVVLIQEKGTPKIFDIGPLRYLEYSRDMKYHEVLKTQEDLQAAIEATADADGVQGNVNSIVKLLGLGKAAEIPNVEHQKDSLALEYIQAEMRDIRHMFEFTMAERRTPLTAGSISAIEYERIAKKLEKLASADRMPSNRRRSELERLLHETEEMAMTAPGKSDDRHFARLMDRIIRTLNDVA